MSMISHEEFKLLRLAPFVEQPPAVLSDWEFLGRIWIGEAVGFSEWLRPADDPENLGALSLDLVDLSEDSTGPILRRLGLPLRRSMALNEVVRELGPPARTESFVADRSTYYFEVGAPDSFIISCTIFVASGLSYITVTTTDYVPE